MRVLVCGGRTFNDFEAVSATLNEIHANTPVTAIISGVATGADSLGERWANERGIPVVPFPADWKNQGHAAGPIRNRKMLKEGCPDIVIAFPGGRGTKHMVDIARDARIPVLEVSGERNKDYPTKVVHCKEEPYDVYIGRPGPWGNPFRIGPDGNRDEVIQKYKETIIKNPEMVQKIKKELSGKVLGCWCKGKSGQKPCHGDVLAVIANEGKDTSKDFSIQQNEKQKLRKVQKITSLFRDF